MKLPKLLSNNSQLKYKTVKFVQYDPFNTSTLYFTSDNCVLAYSEVNGTTKHLKTLQELFDEYGHELVEWEILTRQQAAELEGGIAEVS